MRIGGLAYRPRTLTDPSRAQSGGERQHPGVADAVAPRGLGGEQRAVGAGGTFAFQSVSRGQAAVQAPMLAVTARSNGMRGRATLEHGSRRISASAAGGDDRELLAADPRDQRTGRHRRAERAGDGAQHLVAAVVADRLVDRA